MLNASITIKSKSAAVTVPSKSKEEMEREAFEAGIAKFAAAKKELYRLLRFREFDQDHTFFFTGSHKEAEKFVNNMRTCLSRLRSEALEKNVVLQKFTIKLIEIKAVDNGHSITLRKTKSMDQEMSQSLSLIFSKIAVTEETK